MQPLLGVHIFTLYLINITIRHFFAYSYLYYKTHIYMKRILFFLPIILISLISCNKDDCEINVIIEGIVLNAETTQPIVDAKVEFITKNATYSTSTNESGYFNLGTFTVGDYTIIISKEGFSTQTQQIYAADNPSGGGEYGYEVVKSVVCNLVPATDEAELTIYRQYEDGEVIAANNFPYVISTGDMNAAIEGTTDEFGRISLNNVPQEFTISIDHELNGVRYKTTSSIDIKEDNYLIVYGYYAEASLGLASANILDDDGVALENFSVDGTISLQFTIPVDTSNSTISLLEDAWNNTVYTHTWSSNNMKLDIKPTANLKSGTLYSVNLDLVSPSGMQEFSKAINFVTE